jgi:hypothetical protein
VLEVFEAFQLRFGRLFSEQDKIALEQFRYFSLVLISRKHKRFFTSQHTSIIFRLIWKTLFIIITQTQRNCFELCADGAKKSSLSVCRKNTEISTDFSPLPRLNSESRAGKSSSI